MVESTGQSPVEGDGRWQMIRVRSVADQVADALRWEIHARAGSGVLRLPPETELAELIGVSRGSLRLALRQLAREGIVQSRRGSGAGTFVRGRAEETISVESAMSARRFLELQAVQHAAARPEVADEWERLLGGERYSFERNRAFHDGLLRACGGELWSRMAEPWFEWARARQVHHVGPPDGAQVRDDHLRIVEAVRAGDVEGAAVAMSRHLRRVEETYRSVGRVRRARAPQQ